ncbi:MAG: 50S ribosomal protein L22 [Parcubacteria group bacterium GW2011_GWA1_47_11]|uniref:Large ribosomal subunit protein uL22 n=1 Tax=Candidatus Colwellbacteria bacterium GWA2_46_10 TaxID=1797684 RepID=A0A1G1YX41_9BACT|nr:MAG: 50S ribosomal protein L22 [Parcubacteria group bacterium GW2011_GWA2_46_10]KKU56383.1 MAG: 50S ribosomal protein L22 [Parcubacteria group bacterium GW2011_GWA1_47_11]OGY56942.1 MAG: 50S ribosomal protein L22 [Candidatus Colwellbacteria bacterium GWA2_46_10]
MANKQDKIATASIANLNIAPRKVRLVADLVKGQPVVSAIALLQALPNRSSGPIEKLIHSAVTNARAKNLDLGKLVVQNLTVDKGRVLRRMKAKSRGMAGLVEHKQSHVYLTIQESPDLKGPAYVLPQKVKKVKKEVKEKAAAKGKEKPQFRETEEKPKPEKKGGFVKKFFQRKSI